MTVLSFQNLAFSFGERELFRNVNFEINDKEKVGFIGSNHYIEAHQRRA